jgi:hypothetical protein
MSLWLRQRWVLYKTYTFKNKDKILVIEITQKDVLQQDFEPRIPSIENSCLQAANRKQQTRNRNETMAQRITRERGTTEVQLQTLQTATTGPTVDAGLQPCKVEANMSKQQTTNQLTSTKRSN